MNKLINVAVTGAAGQIGYALLFRLCSGEAFGRHCRLTLRLLEIPPAMKALEGLAMEIDDCAFPLLEKVVITDDPKAAFDGVNWALLVGAKPRTKGMERSDLIRENGPIFLEQGRALAERASSDIRVLVVGNPANTNCLIAANAARGIPRQRFAAMTRLDQNRAQAQLAKKASVSIDDVRNVTIWGNHSNTQYPDAENAMIRGLPAYEVIKDHHWLKNDFIATVQQRGAAVIEARGHSSAASAANAVIDHIRSMTTKTPEGDWFSAAVSSDGSYGVDEELIFSFPLVSDGLGRYGIVQDLHLSDFGKEKFQNTLEELRREKTMVSDLLQ